MLDPGPDPHGSRTFARIRNPENSKLDPDPELIIPDPQHCINQYNFVPR